jgi:hypothetical protein
MKKAISAYLWCWELIQGSNRRKLIPLLATASTSSNSIVEVSLSPSDTNINRVDQPLPITLLCSELLSSKDQPVDNSNSIDMLWSLKFASDALSLPSTVSSSSATTRTISLLHPGLYCDLQFTSKKRLLGGTLSASIDMQQLLSLVREKSVLLGLPIEIIDSVQTCFGDCAASIHPST